MQTNLCTIIMPRFGVSTWIQVMVVVGKLEKPGC